MTLYRRQITCVLFLILLLGLVQIFSTSFFLAKEVYGTGWYFFNRQALFAIFGLLIFLSASKLSYRWLKPASLLAGFGSLGLLLLTVFSPWGKTVGGASRWLDFGMAIRIEPGELAKLSSCLLIAYGLDLYQKKGWNWQHLLIGLCMGGYISALLLQPDFGSLMLICALCITALFTFGCRARYLLMTGMILAIAGFFLVVRVPYRLARVTAFLNPWENRMESGFQLVQSLASIRHGGWLGQGMGESMSKLFYLPEAHTDFSLAVFFEEWGLLGFLLLLLAYAFVVLRSFQLAQQSTTFYAKALRLMLTCLFSYSVLINFAVVLGLLPTKGLALPLLSYGGSSLTTTLLIFGLLLNMSDDVSKKKSNFTSREDLWG